MLTLVNAAEDLTFQQNREFTLDFGISRVNNSACTECACQYSLFYPNGSAWFRNVSGENVDGFCKYTNTSTVVGTYGGLLDFSDGTDFGRSSFEFEVTPSGFVSKTSESIVYFLFLIAAIATFGLVLWGSFKIPWSNPRNDEGIVMRVNDLKYLKAFLMVMCYVLLMWIFGILRSITANFLVLAGASKLFNFLFWIMFSFLWPIIVISFLIVLVSYIESKKIKKALERGLPFR